MDDLPSLFFIFGLIFLNGTFVAAEFAVARLRRTQVDRIVAGGTKEYSLPKVEAAKLLQKILSNINNYISACQVGITISSLTLGAVAEAKVESWIRSWIGESFLNLDTHGIAIVLAIGLITFLHVVLGEIIPKNIALFNAEQIGLSLAYFLSGIYYLFQVPVFVLNKVASVILDLFNIEPKDDGHIRSEAELKLILSSSQAEGILEKEEEQLIQNVFDFNDTVAKDVMIPRTDMTCLRDTLTIGEAAEITNKVSFSRFPVFQERLDNMIGYINIKDILKAFEENKKNENIKSIINEVLKVPDGMYVIDLIKLMQHKKKQIAVLIDEFGGTSGLVTIEDIVEEIFGEIQDENEIAHTPILRLNNGDYLIDGLVSLEELNEKLNTNFHSEHYETIGGLVFGLIGNEPKLGDKVKYENHILVVEKYSKHRVRTVKLINKP